MCRAKIIGVPWDELPPGLERVTPGKNLLSCEVQVRLESVKVDGIEEKIDACIAPIISALNAGGIPARYSCCGHDIEPGWIRLIDGRYLVIFPSRFEMEECMRGMRETCAGEKLRMQYKLKLADMEAGVG